VSNWLDVATRALGGAQGGQGGHYGLVADPSGVVWRAVDAIICFVRDVKEEALEESVVDSFLGDPLDGFGLDAAEETG